MLVDELPPQSRAKTWLRDRQDPHELAAMARTVRRRGWGPHSHTDELLHRIGERLDQLVYVLAKANGGKAAEPAPWRRPGVLGADEIAAHKARMSAPVVDALERERAERERRRAAKAKNNPTR